MTRRLVLAAAILALGAAPARAGSVSVLVRDQDGRPVAKQKLVLREASRPGLHLPGGAGSHIWRPGRRRGTTGSDGRFTFLGVKPGSYAVELQGLVDRTLVHPSGNPFQPTPEVTLFDGRDELEVVVELWRGSRVNVALVLPDDSQRTFRAVFRHLGAGHLVPGVWEVTNPVLAAGGWASLQGPGGEARRVDLRDGEAWFPSLHPGRYRVELHGGDAGEEPVRTWSAVEVRAGETLRLGHD